MGHPQLDQGSHSSLLLCYYSCTRLLKTVTQYAEKKTGPRSQTSSNSTITVVELISSWIERSFLAVFSQINPKSKAPIIDLKTTKSEMLHQTKEIVFVNGWVLQQNHYSMA